MTSSITLVAGREKSLLRRHPWVFSRAVDKVQGQPNAGDTVDILSHKGQWLGRGFYSPQSQIRARVWTFDRNETIDDAFFLRRLQRAKAGREDLINEQGLTGYRLCAAESDGLPGVTIDVYANVVVCQLLSTGAERWRKAIVSALTQLYPDACIYERSDVAVRKKEGLKERKGLLAGTLPAEPVVIEENNGVRILVDVETGHKTGFYLDQRDNRRIAGRYCRGKRVLNCFSYTGTFGVYALKGGASEVVNADVSESALALAKQNAELNRLDLSRARFEQADVFKLLREYREQGESFDVIVLDPPKFAESKAQLNGACRGYKDINMLAFQLLNPGGVLLTFSCSGLMTSDLFQKIVADAALDAGRDAQILERLNQAADHPIGTAYPEGHYLKGLVVRAW
ncbi:class I SAM-dependent methyltransferase [Oceanimonas marisflavi]|uniref:class I SAM-dependent methyltransferase n=1 Tax=Oceanimonas marisflavi TaxID=2059724 RepID=UPI000D30E88B|nr:class I SAM-dependent methyltransferase [Oceanimonas marisflavi]